MLAPDRRVPLGARTLVATLAGVAVGLSWQPVGWWPLLAVGIPAFTLAVRGLRPRPAFGLGYLFGLAMLTVAIGWVHVLGVWVAAALIAFEALFFGLLGILLSLVGRLRWWPLAAAAGWVLVEFAYSRFPFGGFGWTRIGYAAVDTPLAGLLPVVGVAGLSFAVALVAQLVGWAAWTWWSRGRTGGPRVRPVLLAGAAIVAVLALAASLRLYQVEPADPAAGSVNVGIVQGNIPGRGIEAMGRARSVTNNHLSQTVDLMTQVRLGRQAPPDFLLWPENSTDIDPTADPVTRLTVDAAAQLAGRPILVGAVMRGPGPDERQTSALWWVPGQGSQARYNKQNLVPFGEWIPFRAQLKPLIPILDQVGAQSVPGTEPGVLEVDLGGRTVRLGDIICFELAYDRTVHETVAGGAQVLLVQSNNATYGGTGQIEQQFAITRARAMELRREIAVATTNSVSGFIDRDGRVVERTAEFSAASTVVSMPLRTALTPALRFGPWFERGVAGLALVAGVLGALQARRSRRGVSPQRPRSRSRVRRCGRSRSAAFGEHPDPELGRILVIIPTYNEVENLGLIVARVRAAVPAAHVLVADDNSPDGTGRLADDLAAEDGQVHVLHRLGKEGLGAAYLAGFGWGIDAGFDVLVEMDADGSHQPEQLPDLLAALVDADLVLGSRWVKGGRVVNWPKSRELLSRGGNLWARLALGIPLRDATGGYRAFRRATLLGLGLNNVASAGYCFQVDLAWRGLKAGYRVVEVPITFVERERGDSKMSRKIVVEALLLTTWWGLAHRTRQLRSRVTRREVTG